MSELRAEETLRDAQREDEEPPRRLGIGALAQDTVIYGGTRVLLKSLAFLLVPLYAHYLSPSEFGVLELVLATTALVDVFINLPGALARFYFDRDDPTWRRQVISLYFTIEAVYPAVLVGALMAFSGPLAEGIVGGTTFAAFFLIAFADLYLTNIVDLPMNLCRLRRKPVTFATYSLIRGLTQIAFAVPLVAVWHFGVKGILVASLVSVCVAFVVTLREYVRDLTRQLDWGIGREMIAFAWPTIVSGLAFYALNLVDRFFVRYYHGTADTGLYGTAFRFSQIVVVGVFAFRMGWPQWHYSWLRSERHPEMVARGAAYYFFGIGMLAALVSLWILPVFHVVMPERYWDATTAVPPLALAAAGAGAYTVFVVGLSVTKRMRLIPPLAIAGALVAVALYFLLIPPFSFIGAAWSTATAMWTLALLVLVAGQRIYPIPWDWYRIGLAVGLTVALCLLALALDKWMPIAASLPVRAALLVSYPLVLAALGFFPPEHLARARSSLRKLLRLR
ncbi:MAG: oligosaccharide flippase family protein [Gaiellaceae bacterium]